MVFQPSSGQRHLGCSKVGAAVTDKLTELLFHGIIVNVTCSGPALSSAGPWSVCITFSTQPILNKYSQCCLALFFRSYANRLINRLLFFKTSWDGEINLFRRNDLTLIYIYIFFCIIFIYPLKPTCLHLLTNTENILPCATSCPRIKGHGSVSFYQLNG